MWTEEDTFYDPETGFYWFRETPDYSDIEGELKQEIENYRFEKNIEFVYFNVTEACNADCPYCYVPKEKRESGKTMTREEVNNIMDRLLDTDVKRVLFHGVEPLIKKDLIFSVMEDYPEFNYGLQTNGLLLEKQDIDFLKDVGSNIGLSLDAPDPRVNDFLRSEGHYDNTMKLLEELKGYPGLSVITTINKHNEHLLTDMVDHLSSYVETLLMNPVRGTSPGGRDLRPTNLTENFLNAVERAMEHTKNGNRTVIGDYANIVLGILAPASRVLQCDVSPCGGGRRFISITPSGVYPCTEFIGLEEFNKNLEDALNHEAFNKVTNRKVEDIDECDECEYRHLCGAPCPAEVYASEGKLNLKSPYCEFYKSIIEHAFQTIKTGNEKHVIKLENLKKTHEVTTKPHA
ncbi:peptide-modifying radical SAM enzyme CbpB [Methanonatronarchaeum sp. AMET-Sl]|uniref:peptide-modifying radical SAM enzyme CbpB n=1 Tax=Methanonatronarchaeum sp. AMET-Sl TaxID=3037654 RepID=UPI00244E4503|nr:peptide-modifying radical SAM enzyme CbpB [Methanonatronarchaeum sp. AMET-Sl]WGI16915.1 peptide-modifying radical SAM enzyme CbpB [Methanonatronarchaeum sp. AMET-Sl]